jgi:hypothetical protein
MSAVLRRKKFIFVSFLSEALKDNVENRNYFHNLFVFVNPFKVQPTQQSSISHKAHKFSNR